MLALVRVSLYRALLKRHVSFHTEQLCTTDPKRKQKSKVCNSLLTAADFALGWQAGEWKRPVEIRNT